MIQRALSTLDEIVLWDEKLALRRSAVLAITIWITIKSFFWAAEFAYFVARNTGGPLSNDAALAAGGIILAVLGPISFLQKAVFDAYITSKQA